MKGKLQRDCEAGYNRGRILLLYNQTICSLDLSTTLWKNQTKMTVRYGSSDSESTVVGLLQDLKIQYHLGCGVIGVDRGNLEDCVR